MSGNRVRLSAATARVDYFQERGFWIASELTNHQELSDALERLAFLGVRLV